jgi:NitT/TauT family transport system substrate-binding protein
MPKLFLSTWIQIVALFLMLPLSAWASEKITLQLRWVPQAQFAGYYVAAAKGYYKAEGLDVVIQPGGPNINTLQVLAKNQADILVSHLTDVLVAREAGTPMVHVAQIFNRAGLMLTCKKSSGVNTPKDLKGKTLGVWYGGTESAFFSWMSKLGLKPDADFKVLKQGYNVEPLLKDQAACISTMLYNEYWQIIDAGIKEKDLTTFFYEDQGVATLEDGLYVMNQRLNDPAFVARMGKFLRASIKGWNDAVKNPDEAARIVVAADKSGKAAFKTQKRQMENVAELITYANTPKMGYLEQPAYDRTVQVLMSGGPNALLKKNPGQSAYSRAVWQAAQK